MSWLEGKPDILQYSINYSGSPGIIIHLRRSLWKNIQKLMKIPQTRLYCVASSSYQTPTVSSWHQPPCGGCKATNHAVIFKTVGLHTRHCQNGHLFSSSAGTELSKPARWSGNRQKKWLDSLMSVGAQWVIDDERFLCLTRTKAVTLTGSPTLSTTRRTTAVLLSSTTNSVCPRNRSVADSDAVPGMDRARINPASRRTGSIPAVWKERQK